MPQYIKSHSNYVLKKNHQTISDGTIWERDITTIGGVNQFSPGQVPIYKSSNFIITVRNDGKVANQYNKTKWKENESGDTWTLETISGMTSEFEGQNDVKIVLKQDYYDFCDFAYYGSLTEMFRASVNDILQRFPGELYLSTNESGHCTSGMTVDGEKVEWLVYFNATNETEDGDSSNTSGNDDNGSSHMSDQAQSGGDMGGHTTDDVTNPSITNETEGDDSSNTSGNDDDGSNHMNDQTQSGGDMGGHTTDDGGFSGGNETEEWPSSASNNNGWTVVSNPFGIDIHSLKKPKDGDALKYFADEGYRNYEVIKGDNPNGAPITAWTVNVNNNAKFCPNEHIADVTIKSNGLSYKVQVWVGDNNNIVYLSETKNVHIRPIEKFIVDFYNKCDNFEKIILNSKTTPKYKSIFSVIHDNERGYYREMEEFVFPTSYGGYNIDASSFGFDDYTARLSEIGEYYDEYFTDNLYRSMTHEAIKNFDWTYTREFNYGDEDEYVHGGEKVQKALRIFAREFDEILGYINNIKNNNRVTYDERSNVPDYFLIDEVEKQGWDACLVYPYDIKEFEANEYGDYRRDEDGNKIVISDKYNDSNFQLSGDSDTKFIRQFSQNARIEVAPYRKNLLDYADGYFMTCCSGESEDNRNYQPCQYSGSSYYFIPASRIGTVYYDSCSSDSTKLRNRIKSYSDEKNYTFMDVNNEFMRRLAINSPYIWRHKGTVEGIEMILGMFGLRSRRWVDSMPTYRRSCNNLEADYEITEYSSFAGRIEETWDAIHQMYSIDWINSTKAIVYDYRSTSNYTRYGAQTDYLSYQGLPVSYRYEYASANRPYLKVGGGNTSLSTEAYKVAETNESVLRRYLYPNFNKDEQLDGNPYFQMNGGWLAKTVEHSGETKYNFQFDVNDNIAYTPYVNKGNETEESGIIDNYPIYNETVRNIKRVNNISELVSTPSAKLKNGEIYYVSHIEKDVALINGQVYPIKYEYNNDGNNPSRYISLTKNSEYIKVGGDLFFTKYIRVYDKSGSASTYDIETKQEGYEVKAYIKNDNTFMCQGDDDGYYTIDSFCVLDDALPSSGFTNYFIIDNPYYSDRIANANNISDTDNEGWKPLRETDPEYIKINSIKNYYKGNNPHNGTMNYDGGHEYFTYFKRLFKNPIDESLFDERCYENFYSDLDDRIQDIGFSHLIEENEEIKQYTSFISADTKIHYFGNYYRRNVTPNGTVPVSTAETIPNSEIEIGNGSENATSSNISSDTEGGNNRNNPNPTNEQTQNGVGDTGSHENSDDGFSGGNDTEGGNSDDTSGNGGTNSSTSNESGQNSNNRVRYCNNVSFYGQDEEKRNNLQTMYRHLNNDILVENYILSNGNRMLGRPYPYGGLTTIQSKDSDGNPTLVPVDEVTNQIVNNKRFTIRFYLHNKWYSEQGQCELKYLDDIVMNYLTQMIPSTTIVDVQYFSK